MNYLKSIFVCFFVLASFGISFVKENHAFGTDENAAEFSVHKTPQLSQTDQTEHFNCLRHSNEIDVFYFAKTTKPYPAFDAHESKGLEGRHFSFLRKTTQELALSYQFFRLNILSSQAHPPT